MDAMKEIHDRLDDHEERISKIEEKDVPRLNQLQTDHAVLTQMVNDHDREWREDIKGLRDDFRRAEERTPNRIHIATEVALAIAAILSWIRPHL